VRWPKEYVGPILVIWRSGRNCSDGTTVQKVEGKEENPTNGMLRNYNNPLTS
jgi:hypothetical protein